MSFEQTVKDIKSLKIQGAENIAKEAIKSLSFVLEKQGNMGVSKLLDSLKKSKETLFKTRSTEPCMRNALNFVLLDADKHGSTERTVECIWERIRCTLEFFIESEKKIIEYGSEKIKDHSIVYTHCHSSTVTRTIKKATEKGKHLEVHNTETRPRYQGRITSEELAKEGIPVRHYVDSAAIYAMKDADIMLIGADAITAEGAVINKIGSALFAEAAQKRKIPVYICTNSWKFDPETIKGTEEPIEKRDSKEVWENKTKNINVENLAFEKIDPSLITGIISEFGIHKPKEFVKEVQKRNPWMK